MKNRKLTFILGLVFCVALAFGIEWLLPMTRSLVLTDVPGIVIDGEDDNPIYHLEGWDSVGEESYDEFAEEEAYEDEGYEEETYEEEAYAEEEYDEYAEEEYYEEEYYDDEAYDEEEYYEEEYDEEETPAAYQLTLSLKAGNEKVLLLSTGAQECEVLVIDGENEMDFYLETVGTEAIEFPVSEDTSSITVQFSDSQRIINRIQVYEKTGLNGYRLMLFMVIILALYLLFVLRHFIAKHLEYGFAIVAVALLICFSVLVPNMNSLWWDGDIHYQNAYSIGTVFEEYGLGKTLNEWLTEQGLSIPNYLVSGVAVFLGRLMNLSPEARVMLERAISSLAYVAVCFAAIRVAKRYKKSVAAIALIPVSLYTAVSYSYDTSINAFMLLGMVLIINELCTPYEKLSFKNAALITISMVMTSLPKAVYIPMLLVMLLLPLTKFHSKKQHVAYKIGIVAVTLMVLAAFVLPMLQKPEIYTDSRGSGESSTSQMAYILSNIPGFVMFICSTIWNGFFSEILLRSRAFLAYLGGPSTMLYGTTLLFIFYTFVTDNDDRLGVEPLKPLHKGAMGVIAFGIMALIYTVFYITFSETGSNIIQGVQGRYFVPLYLVFAVLVQPRNLFNRMKKVNDYFILLAFNLITTAVIIYQLVLSVYYL